MRFRTDKTGRNFTSISIDIDTYEKLCEIAQKEERSVSFVVKRLAKNYTPIQDNTS
jgi:hypothetical protein